MATLHLISCRIEYASEPWLTLQSALSGDDAVLLLADGIYNQLWPSKLTQPVYALSADADATGFSPATPVMLIDYERFVELGVRYERSLDWH